ncbi:uncharacterized protein METZ01_LOCUS418159, partial [marine metagenome]
MKRSPDRSGGLFFREIDLGFLFPHLAHQ